MKVSFKEEEVKIDKAKLRRMRYRVYALERKNHRTSQYSNPRMIEKIREIIINEYRKNI